MGIHPPFEAFYIEAMLWHATSAKRSIVDVAQWLQFIEEDDERALELPKSALFDRLQNILHQAGCISRYLFPSRNLPIHVDRAGRLREAFKVTDGNPLADRGLRNALEHFDERLDHYLTGHIVGQIVPDHVDYDLPDSDVPLHIFKGFYTSTLTFVLLGVSYEMEHIINEMQRLYRELVECSENGHRLPKSVSKLSEFEPK
jgi:hypothetical protein